METIMNDMERIFEAKAILKAGDAGPEAAKIAASTIASLAPDVIRLLMAELERWRGKQ